MSGEKEFLKGYLCEKRMRFTKQREAILDDFLREEGHVGAEEIYLKLHRKFPRLGRATVYRTVNLLKEAALAREVNFSDKRRRFEHGYAHTHHDHLVCLRCGKTTEFLNHSIEELQERLVKKYSFFPLRHRLEIFGYCGRCAVKVKSR